MENYIKYNLKENTWDTNIEEGKWVRPTHMEYLEKVLQCDLPDMDVTEIHCTLDENTVSACQLVYVDKENGESMTGPKVSYGKSSLHALAWTWFGYLSGGIPYSRSRKAVLGDLTGTTSPAEKHSIQNTEPMNHEDAQRLAAIGWREQITGILPSFIGLSTPHKSR